MPTAQPGILAAPPAHARYLSFSLSNPDQIKACLAALSERIDGESTVIGIGTSIAAALHADLPGLKRCPAITAPGLSIELAPEALWLWLRGDDRGELLHRARRLVSIAAPAFALEEVVDAFKHREGRDLSGYEDGTENPEGEAADAAAIVGAGALAGSSFVATQRWQHDFNRFDAMASAAQDNAIGRRQSDNEELDDAPESAHVKRTAQESFSPEAFVLRRSMPWAEGMAGGLMFVAFGRSFDAFEAQLKRMTGGEDGIVDALFGFTRPVSGAYFWCPALHDGRIDLTPLGL
ncbi:putative iron-dependent peroxidase [Propionivibrio dicarboxylicus]|uniref:Putative iron-dependent peroxidase n=2 Tax=Propionivibrio dicarboxylicus TaxID=83767 RepID=A0A1G8FIT4_9RHOO|nr:putative iron-dependent peroxidase [Propionivibrio dicarboxylicus]